MANVMDLRGLQLSLERKAPHPLYFLYGNEPYLIHDALRALKQKTLAGGVTDFNFDSFFAPDTSPAHIKDVVETLPMMASKRMVVYRNVDKLKDKDWEVLQPLMDQPVESCTTVLVAEAIDKRKKFYKRLCEAGVVVELNSPFENQLPSWIEYIASRHGIEVSKEARLYMVQFIGTNLTEIDREVQKLRDYLGERKTVEPEDVLQVVTRSKVNSIFDLTRAIGERDTAAALTSLAQLLDHGQNEVGVVAMVARHIRILRGVRLGLREGLSGQKLSTKVGVPNFFLKEYIEQARQWDDGKLSSTMEALYETDKALKSSPISSHIWLENMILKTCNTVVGPGLR